MAEPIEINDECDQTSPCGQGAPGERHGINEEAGLTRREMIKLAAGAALAAPLVGISNARAATKPAAADSASQVKAPLFFTREEFQLVDELTELIIPADDHSPGARAAEVAAYIDGRLAESFEEEPKNVWRAGLKLIDSLSQEMHGRAFLAAAPEQRIALLTRISQNETNPQKPEETFFKELKTRTAHAYYTSKIGIHKEMEYKGNSYLKEFVGYDAT
jgi:hypothetical protein